MQLLKHLRASNNKSSKVKIKAINLILTKICNFNIKFIKDLCPLSQFPFCRWKQTLLSDILALWNFLKLPQA